MDKKIATVNRKGEVKAVKPGTTTVIAYAGKEEDEDGINTYKEAVVNVTVYKPTIAFDKKKITLNEKGDAEKLTETLLVTHSGANETVTWKSSNERIVTVVGNNNSATITAMHSGTAVITAVCNGLKVSCRVQVKPVYTRLNTSSYTMYAGGLKPETYQLKAKVSGMSKTIEWSSDHEEFVTVDEKGLLTAQSYGTATITATANGVSAFCTVKVLDSGVIIYGSGSEQNVEKTAILINSKGDNTYQLQAKVTGRNQKVKWLSTATDVFKVSAKGLVTGRMGGSAEVIATANGVEQACAVTVVDTITELDYSNRTLDHADESNKMFTLTATIEGADLRKNVKWESSDPEVLQISNAGTLALLNPTTYGGQATANITGLKKGRAKITVTSNGVSSSCMVYVE